MTFQPDHFSLPHFEGSLEFLICLIQKEEINIYDVTIQQLIEQFMDRLTKESKELEKGAEFIGMAAYLVWLKSQALLPRHEQSNSEEQKIEDPQFEIIHHLIDYCRFKQAAKDLSSREEKTKACYFRGVESPIWKKPLGIDHISLEELSTLFQTMMQKASLCKTQIQEESWRVSDKIASIREELQKSTLFPLQHLFSSEQSRFEIIVIFLAILELMKIGEIGVGKQEESHSLLIFKKEKI